MDALGTLAGGIAHDLNNTLAPIVALSKRLLKVLPKGSRESHNIALIEEAGRRARGLVQQILSFARRDEPKREAIDLAALAQSGLKLLRSTLPTTIGIQEHIAPMPPVLGDEGQIHQVLMNLVTNASHAIGDGMGTITIEVAEASNASFEGGAAVRLGVTDTGAGMSEATRRRIFEPFFTTKAISQGTGLGLSAVHGIIANHGGSIVVDSEPGRGTRFDVFFPIALLSL